MSDDGASVELSSYRDQHFKGTRYDQEKLLKLSCTLYVGNLGKKMGTQQLFAKTKDSFPFPAFYTTEEQIYELFSRCGDIRRIVMGLDKFKKVRRKFCNFLMTN